MLRIARTIAARRWMRSINYYSLFPKTFPDGAPPKSPFQVNTRELRKEYLKAQQQAHPDVAHDGGADSAMLGTAYRALCDPLKRAEHILNLQGIDGLSEGATLQDEDLLMDIMMLREQAAEAEDAGERARLAEANNDRIAKTITSIEAAVAKRDWPAAQKATIELSYWNKLKDALEEEPNP